MDMKSSVALVALTLAVAVPFANAKKFPLVASPSVPSTRGQVETGKDDNGNTKVKVEVEHLAPPENLTPAKTVYVVWFQERGATSATVQGQLRPDKKQKAKFQGVTPMKTFEVIITAETDSQPTKPGEAEVLRASVQP
jgi:hypothetical protein